ncbi:hypothetical protein HOY80DRAFT_945402 [Tuber brumale]|nr:hypothetical protein HOY80DRAFT_945402 [Tuber brumale]
MHTLGGSLHFSLSLLAGFLFFSRSHLVFLRKHTHSMLRARYGHSFLVRGFVVFFSLISNLAVDVGMGIGAFRIWIPSHSPRMPKGLRMACLLLSLLFFFSHSFLVIFLFLGLEGFLGFFLLLS